MPVSISISEHEKALFEHLEKILRRELPLRDGPYSLALREIPEDERAAWGGQRGPLIRDSTFISVYLHFDGLDRNDGPWSSEQPVCLCHIHELDLVRVTNMAEAFVRVARRALHDVQDRRFGDRPWLGLNHLACAMHTLHEARPRQRRSLESCEAVLVGSPYFRNVLGPPLDATNAAMEVLDDWLAAHRTLVKTPTVELSHAPEVRWDPEKPLSPQGVEGKRFGLATTLRLTISDEAGIRDIKEQQVRLVPPSMFGRMPHVLAFLDAWAAALPRAFAAAASSGDDADGLLGMLRNIDTCMPHDLFDGNVLLLKKPKTTKDFEAAFTRRWRLP